MTSEIARFADVAMYPAEPVSRDIGPQVYVLSMNPDPLGDAAAAMAMYRGQVVRDLSEITDDQRREVLTAMRGTKLKAPLEFIKVHFLIEGVSRSFTHQMVRQRTAVFAQESLRFAVKEGADLRGAVKLPPSLARLKEDDPRRVLYEQGVQAAGRAYSALINAGVPAEDARELLPGGTLTRLHYSTDFRNLLEHAGNRLCTQAQFEWRQVFIRLSEAIVNYGDGQSYWRPLAGVPGCDQEMIPSGWQFAELAQFFRPACYLTGKCEFAAMDLDRACKIRNRVDANHEIGRPSNVWDQELDAVEGNPIVVGVGPRSVARRERDGVPVFIGAIQPAEWLLDDTAARVRPGA